MAYKVLKGMAHKEGDEVVQFSRGVDPEANEWFEQGVMKALEDHKVDPYLFAGYYDNEDGENTPVFAFGGDIPRMVMAMGDAISLLYDMYNNEDEGTDLDDLIMAVGIAARLTHMSHHEKDENSERKADSMITTLSSICDRFLTGSSMSAAEQAAKLDITKEN